MGKRPRHGAPGRLQSTSSVCNIRRLIQNGSLAVPGSSAEDVAHALRIHRPELRRKKLKPFIEVVRRVLSTIPSPSSFDCDDEDGSTCRRRRCRQDAQATTSSTTSLSDESTHPPPSTDLDVTKTMLRSQYASQTTTQNPSTNQQVEIEATADKARRVITSDGGDGGDAKPEAPVSEGDVTGDKGPTFADLGGMEEVIEKLLLEVVVPLCCPELPRNLGVRPVAGLLLHGPPGCGKTTLAHAIANETGVPFYKISAPEIVSGISGGSEENIRGLFQKAYRTAPSIVFIDEIDAIASKRENLQREMERRIVTQLMTCMDEFHQNNCGDYSDADSFENNPGYVIVIGATNRPDAVDQALRRPGRFDQEIYLGVPDENARNQILRMLAWKIQLEGKLDFFKIARATPGFVGADLKALVNNAGYLAMKRIVNERRVRCRCEHEEAIKFVQPSLRREGFTSIPDVTWDDVGGLDSLRKEFERYIVRCIKRPEDCDVDALATKRGKEGGWVVERLLNQLLIELDGAGQRKGVYVIGATNRIDVIDDAILRPGRFGKKHYVPLPGADERVSILKAHARSRPMSSAVDLDALARREECSNLTGADLALLVIYVISSNRPLFEYAQRVNEAAIAAMEEKWKLQANRTSSMSSSPHLIELTHFEQALSQLKPSVSEQQRKYYDALSKLYSST
nr:unnamed protein product [Digitaria exilis]